MKRLLTLVILSTLLASGGTARTIADLFASEPGNIFRLLTRTSRLDMVDYYNSGQAVAARNNMGGDSQLLALDSVYLKLQASDVKTVEMRMVANRRDTVVFVIETVLTPVPDSRLTCWSSQWQRLNTAKLFTMPVIDDFMTHKMPSDLRADLDAAAPFQLIELTFDGTSHDTMVARHGLKRFLVASEYARFSPYLTDSITYRLGGTKIKRVKP